MKIKNLTFLHVSEYGCERGVDERRFTDLFHVSYNSVGYVSTYDLKSVDTSRYGFSRVMFSCPAIARHQFVTNKEQIAKHQNRIRFSFGIYQSTRHLFLMDDVIEWSRYHIEFKDIRTAWDIARKMKGLKPLKNR